MMRTSFIKELICHVMLGMAMLMLPISMVYAKAGCCSSHGGVASCDSSSGNLKCKDGTLSKTCKCDGTTTHVVKSKTTTSKVQATPASTSTTATTTEATSVATKAPKGCCSKHGGVAACGKAGYLMCKDGSQSATCKCQ